MLNNHILKINNNEINGAGLLKSFHIQFFNYNVKSNYINNNMCYFEIILYRIVFIHRYFINSICVSNVRFFDRNDEYFAQIRNCNHLPNFFVHML